MDLEAVRSAQRAIRDLAVETPLLRADSLSEISNMAVHLKLETLQPTGSFKIRGAANLISRLPKEWRGRTVVCASTGNHGRAVAYAARALGYRAIVCLSSLVPKVKEDAIAALGAETRRVGTSQDDAMAEAAVLVRDEGCIPVPPFDHPDIVTGQGTAAWELIEETGLKGTRVGGAEISPVHANWIVNVGDARAADVLELVKIAREAVAAKHGVTLELEVKVIGREP